MELLAVADVAGALFSALKGIYALYKVIQGYRNSDDQMAQFIRKVKVLEGYLEGLRDMRIRLRRSGENIDLLVNTMDVERSKWGVLLDIDNDILSSLWQNERHWRKVSKRQRLRWIGFVNKEAAKYNDRLDICTQALTSDKLVISAVCGLMQLQERGERRLEPGKAAVAMEEALNRQGRNGPRS